MLLKTLLLIFGFWIVMLPIILIFVSEKISLVGLYHALKSNDGGGETFVTKLTKIGKCNAYLSLPFIFSFFIVIQTTVNEIDATDAFLLSLPMTLVALFALRLLSNPSKDHKPKLCRFYGGDKENQIVDLHKERLLSFFYSFICAAAIILLVMWSYNVLINMTVEGLITFFKPMGFIEFSSIFLIYLSCLGIFTLVGEFILIIFPPIRTVAVEKD